MSLFVNTNISSLTAQRNLFSSSMQLDKSFERLSSGYRINRASDDAAGLQISVRLSSQVNGLNQAVRNANDAISLTQAADGALIETTESLQRIRQLAINAQNGIHQVSDKFALQKEVEARLAEIDRIAKTTTFAGTHLLTGKFSADFQVGANAGQKININIANDTCGGLTSKGLGISGLNVITDSILDSTSVVGPGQNFGSGQNFLDTSSTVRGDYSFAISFDNGQSYEEINVTLTGDSGRDANIISDAVNNSSCSPDEPVMSPLGNGTSITPDPFMFAESANNPTSVKRNFNVIDDYDTEQGSVISAIDALDNALSIVSDIRTDLGADQNRMSSTLRNLSNINEHLQQSRSRIQDTDFAVETAKQAKAQIMQQAGIAILSQANQLPDLALSLLS